MLSKNKKFFLILVLINFIIFFFYIFLFFSSPYSISKSIDLDNNIEMYDLNFFNQFNQLDPRHWIVLSENNPENLSKYLKYGFKISKKNSDYFNYLKFIYYKNYKNIEDETKIITNSLI